MWRKRRGKQGNLGVEVEQQRLFASGRLFLSRVSVVCDTVGLHCLGFWDIYGYYEYFQLVCFLHGRLSLRGFEDFSFLFPPNLSTIFTENKLFTVVVIP